MPVDIETIRDDVATTTVPYGPYEFQIRYRPSGYDEANKKFDRAKDTAAVDYYLDRLLVDWDLQSGGLPIPPTPAGFARVPLPIKLAVVKAIEGDIVNPTTIARSHPPWVPTATSSSGTPPAAPSAPANGPSALPSGSGSAA